MLKGKGKFFLELLRSFVLLLCIPMITILVICWQANHTVKQQIIASETKSFQLCMEQLEEVFAGMWDDCASLFSDTMIKLYANQRIENGLLEKDSRQRVKEILANCFKEKYYDMFVYYNRNDKVISGRYSSLEASDYYTSYYADIMDKNDFLDMITTEDGKLRCHVLNEGSQNPYLCLTFGYRNKRDSNLNYSVGVVLDCVYLNKLFGMQNADTENSFAFFSEDGDLLFSNNKEMEGVYNLGSSEWENNECGVWTDANDYMVQIQKSAKLNNYYGYFVSSNQFWEALIQLRCLGAIGIGLCIVFSGWFAYKSVVRVYKPIKKIVDILPNQKMFTENDSRLDEFVHIQSVFEGLKEDISEKNKNSLTWLLYGLLEGKEQNRPKEFWEENKIYFLENQFVVCVLYMEVLNKEIEDTSEFLVQNVFEELGERVGKAYFVGVSKNRFALIINLPKDSEEKLLDVLEEGKEFCWQKLQLLLTLGVSKCHENIAGIPEGYKEAREALRYRFLHGNGRIIFYSEIYGRNVNCRSDENSKVYMMILEYIKNRKLQVNHEEFVERLMLAIQMGQEISIDAALILKNEVSHALIRIMKFYKYESESCNLVLTKLKEAATLADFQQILTKQIEEICNRKARKKSKDDILEEVKCYIEENYSDSLLSVTAIGAHFDIQAQHLSKIFKERYDINMSDYLTRVRVDNAKKMLMEKGAIVQEVGEKCGFVSVHVFIRNFKKMEGITPGKYMDFAHETKKVSL